MVIIFYHKIMYTNYANAKINKYNKHIRVYIYIYIYMYDIIIYNIFNLIL